MSAEMQTKVQARPEQNFTHVQTGLLQKKCALYSTPGLVEDSGRDKEKLTLQRSSADQAGTTTVPRFGHDFSRVSVHSRGVIQTKLKINEPGDPYEQEADRVADAVMRMPEPGVQRQAEEEKPIHTKAIASTITPLVQRQAEPEEEEEVLESVPTRDAGELGEEEKKEEELVQPKTNAGATPQITPRIAQDINSFKSTGQPLPTSERAFFEPYFGRDFSDVHVHADNRAALTAQSINARAFTLGRDVVFGAGQYSSGTSPGRRLLAHELTHVVQQSGVNNLRTNAQTGILTMHGSFIQRDRARSSTKRRLYLWSLRNVALTDALIRRTATYRYLRRILKADETEARIAVHLWHNDLSGHSKLQRWKSRRTATSRAKLYLSLARGWIKDTISSEERRKTTEPAKILSPRKDPWALPLTPNKLNHPDYFEYNVTHFAWLDNGRWKLYYTDGRTLTLRWAPPPPVIDCRSDLRFFSDPKEPSKLKFIKAELHEYLRGFHKNVYFPPNMDIVTTLRRPSITVKLSKDSASGKLVQNYINRLTAPKLCPYILKAQRKFRINSSYLDQVVHAAVVFLGSVSVATGIRPSSGPIRGAKVRKTPPKTSAQKFKPTRGAKTRQMPPKTFVPQGNLPTWAEKILSSFKRRWNIGKKKPLALADVKVTGYIGRVFGWSGTRRNVSWGSKRMPWVSRKYRVATETSGRLFGANDAEAKVLGYLARFLKPSSRGTIRLYVDKAVCSACADLFRKFKKRFPNITLKIYAKR